MQRRNPKGGRGVTFALPNSSGGRGNTTNRSGSPLSPSASRGGSPTNGGLRGASPPKRIGGEGKLVGGRRGGAGSTAKSSPRKNNGGGGGSTFDDDEVFNMDLKGRLGAPQSTVFGTVGSRTTTPRATSLAFLANVLSPTRTPPRRPSDGTPTANSLSSAPRDSTVAGGVIQDVSTTSPHAARGGASWAIVSPTSPRRRPSTASNNDSIDTSGQQSQHQQPVTLAGLMEMAMSSSATPSRSPTRANSTTATLAAAGSPAGGGGGSGYGFISFPPASPTLASISASPPSATVTANTTNTSAPQPKQSSPTRRRSSLQQLHVELPTNNTTAENDGGLSGMTTPNPSAITSPAKGSRNEAMGGVGGDGGLTSTTSSGPTAAAALADTARDDGTTTTTANSNTYYVRSANASFNNFMADAVSEGGDSTVVGQEEEATCEDELNDADAELLHASVVPPVVLHETNTVGTYGLYSDSPTRTRKASPTANVTNAVLHNLRQSMVSRGYVPPLVAVERSPLHQQQQGGGGRNASFANASMVSTSSAVGGGQGGGGGGNPLLSVYQGSSSGLLGAVGIAPPRSISNVSAAMSASSNSPMRMRRDGSVAFTDLGDGDRIGRRDSTAAAAAAAAGAQIVPYHQHMSLSHTASTLLRAHGTANSTSFLNRCNSNAVAVRMSLNSQMPISVTSIDQLDDLELRDRVRIKREHGESFKKHIYPRIVDYLVLEDKLFRADMRMFQRAHWFSLRIDELEMRELTRRTNMYQQFFYEQELLGESQFTVLEAKLRRSIEREYQQWLKTIRTFLSAPPSEQEVIDAICNGQLSERAAALIIDYHNRMGHLDDATGMFVVEGGAANNNFWSMMLKKTRQDESEAARRQQREDAQYQKFCQLKEATFEANKQGRGATAGAGYSDEFFDYYFKHYFNKKPAPFKVSHTIDRKINNVTPAFEAMVEERERDKRIRRLEAMSERLNGIPLLTPSLITGVTGTGGSGSSRRGSPSTSPMTPSMRLLKGPPRKGGGDTTRHYDDDDVGVYEDVDGGDEGAHDRERVSSPPRARTAAGAGRAAVRSVSPRYTPTTDANQLPPSPSLANANGGSNSGSQSYRNLMKAIDSRRPPSSSGLSSSSARPPSTAPHSVPQGRLNLDGGHTVDTTQCPPHHSSSGGGRRESLDRSTSPSVSPAAAMGEGGEGTLGGSGGSGEFHIPKRPNTAGQVRMMPAPPQRPRGDSGSRRGSLGTTEGATTPIDLDSFFMPSMAPGDRKGWRPPSASTSRGDGVNNGVVANSITRRPSLSRGDSPSSAQLVVAYNNGTSSNPTAVYMQELHDHMRSGSVGGSRAGSQAGSRAGSLSATPQQQGLLPPAAVAREGSRNRHSGVVGGGSTSPTRASSQPSQHHSAKHVENPYFTTHFRSMPAQRADGGVETPQLLPGLGSAAPTDDSGPRSSPGARRGVAGTSPRTSNGRAQLPRPGSAIRRTFPPHSARQAAPPPPTGSAYGTMRLPLSRRPASARARLSSPPPKTSPRPLSGSPRGRRSPTSIDADGNVITTEAILSRRPASSPPRRQTITNDQHNASIGSPSNPSEYRVPSALFEYFIEQKAAYDRAAAKRAAVRQDARDAAEAREIRVMEEARDAFFAWKDDREEQAAKANANGGIGGASIGGITSITSANEAAAHQLLPINIALPTSLPSVKCLRSVIDVPMEANWLWYYLYYKQLVQRRHAVLMGRRAFVLGEEDVTGGGIDDSFVSVSTTTTTTTTTLLGGGASTTSVLNRHSSVLSSVSSGLPFTPDAGNVATVAAFGGWAYVAAGVAARYGPQNADRSVLRGYQRVLMARGRQLQ